MNKLTFIGKFTASALLIVPLWLTNGLYEEALTNSLVTGNVPSTALIWLIWANGVSFALFITALSYTLFSRSIR